MSLGQLALHVATLPGQLTEFVTGDALDFSAAGSAPPTIGSHQELLAAFRVQHRAGAVVSGDSER